MISSPFHLSGLRITVISFIHVSDEVTFDGEFLTSVHAGYETVELYIYKIFVRMI